MLFAIERRADGIPCARVEEDGDKSNSHEKHAWPPYKVPKVICRASVRTLVPGRVREVKKTLHKVVTRGENIDGV